MSIPASRESHVRNIAFDLVLTVLTFGAFGLYVEHRQIQAINDMIGERRYRFWRWIILSLITIGIYNLYHEYSKSLDICRALNKPPTYEPALSVAVSLFTFNVLADAIQQIDINRFYSADADGNPMRVDGGRRR